VAAIRAVGVRGDPCGAMRWTGTVQRIAPHHQQIALDFEYMALLRVPTTVRSQGVLVFKDLLYLLTYSMEQSPS